MGGAVEWGAVVALHRRDNVGAHKLPETSVALRSGNCSSTEPNNSGGSLKTARPSSPSRKVITIRRDTAPAAAKIAGSSYARIVGLCRAKWKLAVTKHGYRRARRKRLQTEIRLQFLLRWYVDGVQAIQTAREEFIEASQRYEAALNAYCDYLAEF